MKESIKKNEQPLNLIVSVLLFLFAGVVLYAFLIERFSVWGVNSPGEFLNNKLYFKQGGLAYFFISTGVLIAISYSFLKSKTRSFNDAFDAILLFYLIWCGLSLLWAPQINLGWSSLTMYLSFGLFYYFTYYLLQEHKAQTIRLLRILFPILIILFVAHYFYWNSHKLARLADGQKSYQSIIKGTRTFFGGKNLSAMYLTLSLPILIFLSIASKKMLLNIAICVLALFLILLLGSRNAYLAITIFALLVLFLMKPNMKWIGIGLSILLILLVVFLYFIDSEYFLRQLKRNTFISRTRVWQPTFELFLRSPLQGLGIGQWNFYNQEEQFRKFVHPHNDFLRQLSELGIIGAALFYSLIGILIFRLRQLIQLAKDNTEKLKYTILLGGVLSYICLSSLDECITKINIMYLLMIIWALTNHHYHLLMTTHTENKLRAKFLPIMIGILSLGLLSFTIYRAFFTI